MNCPDCGLENPPVRDACAFCDEALAPGERREEWEKLSPALREEFSKNFERALAARRSWRESLRRRRVVHAISGGCLSGFLLAFTHGPVSSLGSFATFVVLLLDTAAGVGCGLALNFARGGEYRGMALFGGVYAASTAAKLSTGAIQVSVALGFFVMPGMLAALVFGYLFGLNMSMRRTIDE
ncbi:MAG TPA: hypothetical protein VF950_14745 [Planctomycetota bacterium]